MANPVPLYKDGDTIIAAGRTLVVVGTPSCVRLRGGRVRIAIMCRKPKGTRLQQATQESTATGWTDLKYQELNWPA